MQFTNRHWGYLGVVLNSTGTLQSELSRKFGRAWGEFRKLAQLWKHTSLPLRRKIEIFQAVITSQVMYGLSSAWLTIADQRRLDGFQARCLRVLLRVAPSFVSRVSNKTVLAKAQQIPYTRQLLQQQLRLFGKVARAADSDILRMLTFAPGTLEPVLNSYVRKVGRPRHEWAPLLIREALKFTSTHANLGRIVKQAPLWESAVSRHCRQPCVNVEELLLLVCNRYFYM